MNMNLPMQYVAMALRYPGLTIGILTIVIGMGFLAWRWSQQDLLTLDHLKMMFGFVLLSVVAGLAVLTIDMNLGEGARAEVSQILTMIGVLAGAFAQWAFSSRPQDGKPNGGANRSPDKEQKQ